MSSAPGMLPRKAISDMIIHVLSQKGKTITMIESERGRAYKGDASQEPYRDQPKWYNRQDMITTVAKNLKVHHTFVGPNRTSSDFYNAVDQEIAKIRKNGLISEWNSSKPSGIWRVIKTLPVVDPEMSIKASTATHAELQDTADLKRMFLSILSKGRKDNTYKFTLAKSLLDYCREASDDRLQKHEIPYEYFASKFLKYYWYQEYKFRMKQDFRVKSKPKVITALNEVFGKNPPADFEILDPDDIKKVEKKILNTVFGHARTKTSLVIPKFQKIPIGGHAQEYRVFYDYDDDKKMLYLKPEAFDFLRQNHGILSKVVLAEWAKFLEKINHAMPRLVAKIEQDTMERGSLVEYRRMFATYTDHCFYCADKLERDHTHVDHFIPWSYIFDDDAWNLVLACQECNCKKSNSLPQKEFRDMLLKRNSNYYNQIRRLKLSLDQLNAGRGWRPEIINHYTNCHQYGFNVIKLP